MKLLDVTLSEVLAHHAQNYPEDTAYIFEGRTYSWAKTEALTDRMAADMLREGIEKGSHVGLWGVNSIALAFALYAAMKIGAIPVLVNFSYKELELRSVLDYADVEFLYYGRSTGSLNYPSVLSGVKDALPLLRACWDVEDLLREEEAAMDAGVPMDEAACAGLARAKGLVKSHDTACMLFTSGTTRRPKGVLLSQYSILNDARTVDALMGWDRRRDRLLSAMPIFHCSGMTCGLMLGVMLGMTVVLMPTFKAEQAMELIQCYRCTAFNVVPSMMLQMVRHPAFGRYDLSSWRSGTSSGSGLTPERYMMLVKELDVPMLQVAYGQTETSPLITFSARDDDQATKAETIGHPIPNMEVRIWNRSEDREALVDEVGEIQARGFCIMQGYYKLEKENHERFLPDGWMRTGDLGSKDGRGYFRFVSRMSEMIIRGGENISPAEIECVIRKADPSITEVKVVGVETDTAMQEEIVAFVQMAGKAKVDEKKIIDYVRGHLASFKAPKYVLQIKNFPVTGSGKIDQKALRSLAATYVQS